MRTSLIAAMMVAASTLLCLGIYPGGEADAAQTDPSWTIMVYMANDFEVSPLPWEENINSMEDAVQSNGMTIVALVDNSDEGDSVILKVEHDPSITSPDTIVSTEIDDGGAVIDVSGEVNMSNPSTLTSFIVFSATEFPADRLVLVLWGHGDGWHGLCPDKGDLLTLPELSTALMYAEATLGRAVDMVVVDACVGATAEMLAELAPYVSYFVGAQSNVPYQGLPYDRIINALSAYPSQSLEEFAGVIVSEYIDFAWYVSPYSATMAAFDMGKVYNAFYLLDKLSIEGIKYSSIFHAVINEALLAAEYYDTEWYVDLVDLMTIIHESELPLEMKTLALQTAVSFRGSLIAFGKYDHPDPADGVGVERANGAVIYAPSTSVYEADYDSLAISSFTQWDEFGTLARLAMPSEPMDPGPAVFSIDSDHDGLVDTVHLEWEEDYPRVEAWVFTRLPNGYLFRGSIVSFSSNITIHGYPGNLVIAANAQDSDYKAVSYTALNVALYGHIRLDIFLTRNGVPVEEELDVLVVSSTYTAHAVPNGDAQSVILIVPTQACVGEMVVIRILDGEDLLLTARVVVGSVNSTITIEVYHQGEEVRSDDAMLLGFSLLPAILLGVFTILLYVDYRRARRNG